MVRWLHTIGAAVWVGGLITLGAVVAALRKAGADRDLLRVVARRFGVVSWTAMAVSVASGAWLAVDWIGDPLLAVKFGLVALVAALAAWHQFAAGHQSPALRGIIQALILVTSLAIVAVAVAL